MNSQVKETVEFLTQKGFTSPKVGIVLGTGLGKFLEEVNIIQSIPYSNIPNFPEATVEFHSGNLIFGEVSGTKVVAMQGRFHYYEGYTMQQVTFPIRVMKALGIEMLTLSNAAGAINLEFKKGEVMLLTDHINLQPENPLVGKNEEEWGPRFPDMSKPYDPQLNQTVREISNKMNISLHEGVYVSVPGPNLESPAEYRYLKVIGADAVGMSTVPEVIVANHMGLPCCAFSVLTDECNPDDLEEVVLEDILAQAAKAEPKLIQITKALIARC